LREESGLVLADIRRGAFDELPKNVPVDQQGAKLALDSF
jgi:hypothetical protein